MRAIATATVLFLSISAVQAQAPTPAVRPLPPRPTTTMAMPAPGGGPGQVWVNTRSRVYHCQGDRYYGNTKQGSYMTEAAARAAGDHPDHGRACGT